jgi:hypothetical protein
MAGVRSVFEGGAGGGDDAGGGSNGRGPERGKFLRGRPALPRHIPLLPAAVMQHVSETSWCSSQSPSPNSRTFKLQSGALLAYLMHEYKVQLDLLSSSSLPHVQRCSPPSSSLISPPGRRDHQECLSVDLNRSLRKARCARWRRIARSLPPPACSARVRCDSAITIPAHIEFVTTFSSS